MDNVMVGDLIECTRNISDLGDDFSAQFTIGSSYVVTSVLEGIVMITANDQLLWWVTKDWFKLAANANSVADKEIDYMKITHEVCGTY